MYEHTTEIRQYPHFEDEYSEDFGRDSEDSLLEAVAATEADDQWIADVQTDEFRLTAVDGPVFADQTANEFDLDLNTTIDTAANGTRLIAHRMYNGERFSSYCVRDCARGSMYDSAKLNGSALSRMSSEKLAETLNNGFEIARGSTLLLVRAGKVSAFHSGAAGGYCVMPISELLKNTKRVITSKFGAMEFISGHHQHSYTSAVWTLPEAADELAEAYEEALKEKKSSGAGARGAYRGNIPAKGYMPGVKFSSSDTQTSAATLYPVFFTEDGTELKLNDGVKVKHEKKKCKKEDEKEGVELYTEQIGDMYALFVNAIEKACELSMIPIMNPLNCIVSLCKKYDIPKKWGNCAYEEAESLFYTTATAHDIYVVMSDIVGEAKRQKATQQTLDNLSEKVAKILNADWTEHDVNGVVAWKD